MTYPADYERCHGAHQQQCLTCHRHAAAAWTAWDARVPWGAPPDDVLFWDAPCPKRQPVESARGVSVEA